MTLYQEYTLPDGKIKIRKVVKGRYIQEEMKLLYTSERDILSIQLLDKNFLQKPK
ncbi:hypothetical protein [Priestia endophytica]|uniref:Uncharacterized protein n=1 Tax=Priestia endophytica DSM 13796 TaxID=1121089 RepID=A0A1I5YPK8_9BACI|nr:hypothetical protein [Priestia endophytica]SFQ45985.1 hypothetical protein SAMN02745910_01455 [Priestia endophytica DSM 13796]